MKLSLRHVSPFGLLVPLALLAVNACGGSTAPMDAGSDGVALDDAVPLDDDAAVSLCTSWYAAQYLRCGGPTLPPSEGARQQARFEQSCASLIALPGSGVTADALSACIAALNASPCDLPEGPPVECNFAGSRGADAGCNSGVQCQSGACYGTSWIESPEGPMSTTSCGTCLGLAPVGGVCAYENTNLGCPTNAMCVIVPGDENAPNPSYTCTVVNEGALDAGCDGLTSLCQPDLACSSVTSTCTALLPTGATCGVGGTTVARGYLGGCVAPDECVSSNPGSFFGPFTGTCMSGAAGAGCSDDFACAPGLGCVDGGCATVSWVAGGAVCNDQSHCLVGACTYPGLGMPSPGAIATCPVIVPDGQPCTAGSTCDAFSICFQPKGADAGTCVLSYGSACE